jgi:hypothetical protein
METASSKRKAKIAMQNHACSKDIFLIQSSNGYTINLWTQETIGKDSKVLHPGVKTSGPGGKLHGTILLCADEGL